MFFLSAVFTFKTHAQLGFCSGNSGEPIFTQTFGTGTNYGPQLPTGTTTYSFLGGSGPQDGEYTVGRNTSQYGWNLPSDHTVGDTNGKALIVNASFTSGEFYKTSIKNLCENSVSKIPQTKTVFWGPRGGQRTRVCILCCCSGRPWGQKGPQDVP